MSYERKLEVPVLDLQTLAVARAGSRFRAGQVIRSVGPNSQAATVAVVGRIVCKEVK